ncbi:hypothetical protein [Streptomyces profundus]|uniref:hypothetical protein n=1 Tax=Streptomyces profundus TaxID=2867410 RepID=UPI001D165C16|nr:hypothetical protein [Streptomyces sp. MA3_2.13]UED85965.1 hypothetical protein K4G22_18710 [Streptomyces sp. MA3_2.13]
MIVFLGACVTLPGMTSLAWISIEFEEGHAEFTLNEVAKLLPKAEGGTLVGGVGHTYLQYLSLPTALTAVFASLRATWPRHGAAPRRTARVVAMAACVLGLVGTLVLAIALNGLGVREGYWVSCDIGMAPWVTGVGLGTMLLGVCLGTGRGPAVQGSQA